MHTHAVEPTDPAAYRPTSDRSELRRYPSIHAGTWLRHRLEQERRRCNLTLPLEKWTYGRGVAKRGKRKLIFQRRKALVTPAPPTALSMIALSLMENASTEPSACMRASADERIVCQSDASRWSLMHSSANA